MDRRRVLLIVAVVVAALGAALVFVYARSAENRAAERYETRDVLVVTQPIERGESTDDAFSTGKIESRSIPSGQILAGASAEGDDFDGLFALTPLYPGEQMIPEKFGDAEEVEAETTLPIPAGMLAASVSLTESGRVAGFVQPGARVAVFVTCQPQGADVQTTQLLLENVQVLGIGTGTALQQPGEGEEGEEPVDTGDATLFTLALTQKQNETILTADAEGELTLALITEDSKLTPDGQNTDPCNLVKNENE